MVRQNDTGITVGVETTDDGKIDANEILENEAYEVVVQDMQGRVPDALSVITNGEASENWWSDEMGAVHEELHPSGRGDGVGDNVGFEPGASRRSGRSEA